MLEELRIYKNLGTPNYFFELLNTLKASQEAVYTTIDIEKLFYNRVIDDRSVFDGCLILAVKIGVLVNKNSFLSLSNDIVDSLNIISQMNDKFVEFLFKTLESDDEFHEIFCSDYLSYDIFHKSLQINNRAFGLKYSNFKQLLIDFKVISPHPTTELNNFIINSSYKKIFDKTVLPEIKQRKISVEQFRKTMEQQQVYGEEAEKFVLDFEFLRLNCQKQIDWVAEYIVNEGYDVASYNHESDELQNRFIEVKSYDGRLPYFYWSRNEYSVAKLRQNEYWLYLINRSEMTKKGYQPIMIRNPFLTILCDDLNWYKQIDNYKIEMI